jgi:hypothetical protein
VQILFDGGRVVDYLKKVKKFIDANPNEVITLLFTNPENLSVKDVWKPAFDESGWLVYFPTFGCRLISGVRDHSSHLRSAI